MATETTKSWLAWISETGRDLMATAVSKVGTWVEDGIRALPKSVYYKTPMQLDYFNKNLWLALYTSELQRLKKAADRSQICPNDLAAALYQLNGMIGKHTLSPQDYPFGLQELLEEFSTSSPYYLPIKNELKKYYQDLAKEDSRFLLENFEADLLNDTFTYIESNQGHSETVINTLEFYRDYIDADVFYFKIAKLLYALDQSITKSSLIQASENVTQLIAKIQQTFIDTTLKGRKQYIQHLKQYMKKQMNADKQSTLGMSQEQEEPKLPDIKVTATSQKLFKFFTEAIDYTARHPLQVITMLLATHCAVAAATKPFSGDDKGRIQKKDKEDNNKEIRPIPYNEHMPQRYLDKVKEEVKFHMASHFMQQKRQVERDFFSDDVFQTYEMRNDNNRQTSKSSRSDLIVSDIEIIEIGEPFTINRITDDTQNRPQVIELVDNVFFTIWRDVDSTQLSQGPGIYGRAFNAGNLTDTPISVGGEIKININGDSPNVPSLAKISDEFFVVVWPINDSGTDEQDIFGRVFNIQGASGPPCAATNEFQININDTTGNQQLSDRAAVAGLSDNRFIVVWDSLESDIVRAQVFSMDDPSPPVPVGSDFRVHQNDGARLPMVTVLDNGNFIVTWANFISSPPSIRGQLYDASVVAAEPTRIGSEFIIHADAQFDSNQMLFTIDNNHFVTAFATDSDDLAAVYDANSITGTPTRSGSVFPIQDSRNCVNCFITGARLSRNRHILGWRDVIGGTPRIESRIFRTFTAITDEQEISDVPTTDASAEQPSFAALNENTIIFTSANVPVNATVGEDENLVGQILQVVTPPTLTENNFNVTEDTMLPVTISNIDAIDLDGAADDAIEFRITDLNSSIHFENNNSPGNEITSFTKEQVINGDIAIFHSGTDSDIPAFNLSANNGILAIPPQAANIIFTTVNDRPVVLNSILDQVITVGDSLNLFIPNSGNGSTFVDEEDGTSLTYTVDQTDGSQLPSWLRYIQANSILDGMPGDNDIGDVIIRVTATDSQDAMADTNFTISVMPIPPTSTTSTSSSSSSTSTTGGGGGGDNDIVIIVSTIVGSVGILALLGCCAFLALIAINHRDRKYRDRKVKKFEPVEYEPKKKKTLKDYTAEDIYLLLYLQARNKNILDKIAIAPPLDNICETAVKDYLQLYQNRDRLLLIPYYLALAKEPRWLGLMVTWSAQKIDRISIIDVLSTNKRKSFEVRVLEKSLINAELLSEEQLVIHKFRLKLAKETNYSGAVIVEHLIELANNEASPIRNEQKEKKKTKKPERRKGKEKIRISKKEKGKEKAGSEDDTEDGTEYGIELMPLGNSEVLTETIEADYEQHRKLIKEYNPTKKITPKLKSTEKWTLYECRQIVKGLRLIAFFEKNADFEPLLTTLNKGYRKLYKKKINFKDIKRDIHKKMKECIDYYQRGKNRNRLNDDMLQALFQFLYGNAMSEDNEFLLFTDVHRLSYKKLCLPKKIFEKIENLVFRFSCNLLDDFLKDYIRRERYLIQSLTAIENRFNYEQAAMPEFKKNITPRTCEQQIDLMYSSSEIFSDANTLITILNDPYFFDVDRDKRKNTLYDIFNALIEKFLGNESIKYNDDVTLLLLFTRLQTSWLLTTAKKITTKERYKALYSALTDRLNSKNGKTNSDCYQGLLEFIAQAHKFQYAKEVYVENDMLIELSVIETILHSSKFGKKGNKYLNYIQLRVLIALLSYMRDFGFEIDSIDISPFIDRNDGHKSALKSLQEDKTTLNFYLAKYATMLLKSLVKNKKAEDENSLIVKINRADFNQIYSMSTAVSFGSNTFFPIARVTMSGIIVLAPLLCKLNQKNKQSQLKAWHERLAVVEHTLSRIAHMGHNLSDWENLIAILTDKHYVNFYKDKYCVIHLVDVMMQYYRDLAQICHPQQDEIQDEILKFLKTYFKETARRARLFMLAHLSYLSVEGADKKAEKLYEEFNKLHSGKVRPSDRFNQLFFKSNQPINNFKEELQARNKKQQKQFLAKKHYFSSSIAQALREYSCSKKSTLQVVKTIYQFGSHANVNIGNVEAKKRNVNDSLSEFIAESATKYKELLVKTGKRSKVKMFNTKTIDKYYDCEMKLEPQPRPSTSSSPT